MGNVRALAPVERMAELEPQKISNLAGQIVPLFPRDCTREQAMEVARVALAYGLDPLMGELIPYQGRPYITIAGRWRIANDHPAYDGEETVPATENERRALGAAENEIVWRCTVYRKDRRLPTIAWGRAGGQGETNTVARRWTAEIAIKRAQHRALRAAFPNQIPTVPEDRDTRLDDLDERISDAQLKRIHALDRDAGVSDEERRAALEAKFAVSSSRELTTSQASAYMDERAVTDAQFSEVTDAPTPINEPTGKGPLDPLGRKRAAEAYWQMAELRNYSESDMDAWMQHHGFAGIKDMPKLTEQQADAMKRDAVQRKRPWLPEPPAESVGGDLIGDDFDDEDADGAAS